jgi:hypothetical protein
MLHESFFATLKIAIRDESTDIATDKSIAIAIKRLQGKDRNYAVKLRYKSRATRPD